MLAQYLNAEHQAHWLLMQNESNHLLHVNDDVIDLEHINLHHLDMTELCIEIFTFDQEA